LVEFFKETLDEKALTTGKSLFPYIQSWFKTWPPSQSTSAKKIPAFDRCSTSLCVRLPSARRRFSSKLRGIHYGEKGSVETKLKLSVASNRSARDRPMRRCAAAGAWGAASCGSGGAPLSWNCSAWVPIAGVR
jgi:hypothetical protein